VILTALGQPWLYALWVIAFMTSHMLISRIRQISEHAAVPDLCDLDARRNTRTIYINPLERLLVAPHDLNYHLEHHLLASVPIYRLRKLHDLLLSRGYYEGVDFPRGYFSLLRQVTYAG
ncbi:MAG: fatty acid desaturase, partial [Gammaproteobacteria bacterium]|nr:fatty acid desaturase [Gammaproteobacteria bacterium]